MSEPATPPAAPPHAGPPVLAARLLVVAGAMLWGTTGTTQALAPAAATSTQIGAVRLVTGGLALLVVAGLVGGGLRAVHAVTAPATRRLVAMAAATMVGYQLAFFSGVARTGVAVGTVVTIGSAPVFAGVLGWLVHRHRPDRLWAASTTLAVVGTALLVGSGGTGRVDAGGVALALVSGLAYAGYTVATKSLLGAGHRPAAVLAATFVLAGLVVSPLLMTDEMAWVATLRGAAVVAWLAVGTVALGYLLHATGLRSLTAATVATLTLAEPLTAAGLGIGLLGERPGTVALVGAALVGGGLVVLALRPARAAPDGPGRSVAP